MIINFSEIACALFMEKSIKKIPDFLTPFCNIFKTLKIGIYLNN